ncbi:MAG: VOC family protein [Alphaproteobacteria bacterium]|nr:VOC family protein [Alphaproteobacteria bacterium]
MGLIGGIDHVVIAVRGLDDAYTRYAHLGFTLTPRGVHTQLDTANHTIMFPDMTYFEVLAVTRPGVKNAYYADFVRQREGVAGIALKADDARVVQAALKDAPFHASDAIDFARPVDMPQGRAEARFTVTQFDPVATPGARFFVCQHYTPDVVWRRDMLTHANGALGLKGVTIVVRDPLDAARRYETLFGAKLQRQPDRIDIPTASGTLSLVAPATFAERHAGDPIVRLAPPYCAALSFKVVDRVTTDMALRARGVATRTLRDGTVVVGSTEACGTILTFG